MKTIGGVTTLRGTLLGTERARIDAEARYLNGHDCLFPELAAAWRGLRDDAGLPSGDVAEDMATAARREVTQVVGMARADGLEAIGHTPEADRVARRVARAMH